MDTETVAAASPAELRTTMVDRLKAHNVVRAEVVEEAMRSVARHVFVPDAPL